jgi:YD repeat-containing protein
VSGTYDLNTGLLASFTDANSQTSSYGYDNKGRMASASFPDGGQTSFCYSDTMPDGSRVEKTTGGSNPTGTIYWYISPGIVAESDLPGTLKSEYVNAYDPGTCRINQADSAGSEYLSFGYQSVPRPSGV